MCTHPDRRSTSTSARAVRDATLSLMFAIGVLLLALLSAPLRWLERRRPKSRRAATVGHVDVQVHLEDRKCVGEIKRVLRQTLRLTARTWAPLTLPIDRVVVGVGFPPGGRADVYDKFPTQSGKATASASSRPLVVVSLGVRDGERDLEAAEVACALAAQIQSVINERYGQRATTVAVSTQPSTNMTPARPLAAIRPGQPAPTAKAATSQPAQAAGGSGLVDPASVPRLLDLLATVQEGQPLDAAGPASAHTSP
jgi:hypothetical protein